MLEYVYECETTSSKYGFTPQHRLAGQSFFLTWEKEGAPIASGAGACAI